MKNLICLLLLFNGLYQLQAQSVTPKKGSEGKFSIDCANLYFEVDSARGARISSFKINQDELLYVDFNTTDMAGSTFWPSPQIWSWPPAVNLDSKPYSSKITGDTILFKGATDAKLQLRFYKSMFATLADTSVTIEYVIKNEKTSAQSWAPWEITRVPATGLTVFSKESGTVTGDMASRVKEMNGYEWYDQTLTNTPGNKFFCDGKGWIAHVTVDNYLFVKKFENIPASKKAPNEAEVEVYTAGNDSYTELENQGAYASIASKDSVRWKVKWYARYLHKSVEISVGSPSLITYIEKILALDNPTSVIKPTETSALVKLYPNPASGQLTLETRFDVYKDIQLTIINLQGKVISSLPISGMRTRIDIQQLPKGICFYEIKKGNNSLARGKFSVVR